MASPAEIAAQVERNAVDVLPAGALAKRLAEVEELDRPLRVKLGIDPTAPDIHLGHTVVLAKLREFQDAGHVVVLIIGDYTARVGDPSGRSKTRPELTPEAIDTNAETFQEQAFKVLDAELVEVRRNSEWLDMQMTDLFKLMRLPTVAQLLERDDFGKRYSEHTPIALLELLYPLLQAYDSVAVRSDLEIGGTDQKFNLLLGRDIQQAYGQTPQVVMTMPILPGIDGVRRMGKSLGNHIGVTEPSEEIFGKTMSIPDEVMPLYYDLLLGRDPDSGEPRVAQKRRLAREIVARYYDPAVANSAEDHFDRLFKQHNPPDVIDEYVIEADGRSEVHIPGVLADAFAVSRSEARRLIDQGGVSIDGETIPSDRLDVTPVELDGKVVKLGKRRFKRLRAS